ncbi:Beta-hexosaminidase [Ephemeroptericola cinctiostellae]|uniref:Beta-hexosaminidase n=1 Tax=Ephemeroptericola cinctiostellae TaxID=2268024 RepID=A0A345DD40_9BURK|nr:Beta-hexosaminidase [Ephemeroptericola cinctiostellae]
MKMGVLTSKKSSRLGPIVVDLLGSTLTEEDSKRLQHPLTGGVIIFGRNFKSRVQITRLIHSIRALRPELLISVDHEGGRVQRFKADGFTHLPAMRVLGQLWMTDPLNAMRVTTAAGFVLAAELRAVGVDYSYTPVLDLDFGESTVIGDRAFSHDARVVTMLAKALQHGLLQAGMKSCGKHFPGHGFVAADSHTDMPVDKRSLKRIMAEDVLPYQMLMQDLAAVMPAHVVYPKVDAQAAGFSKTWLGMLREQLGFSGAIVSDDLSMAGAALLYPDVVERVKMALDAGCDQVLICNRPQDVDLALNGLPTSYLKAVNATRLEGLCAVGEALPWSALQKDARYLNAKKAIEPYLHSRPVIDPTAVMLQTETKGK